ncbi:response regulator [Pseudoduganella lutea]|uniref:response regulator n=1 Tax=Pseudoduganella lutea TaxID=321985 RepID=UPI001E5BEB37|nr:response regulator [Pseudoduganella lutea]
MASSKKILIVDDNVDAADLTADVLRMHGLDVTVAYGGLEGLAAAKTSGAGVIFLDLGMPGMDGYEVARRLRADGAFGATTIVALTAWGDSAARERTAAAGFDLHLTKPASLAMLVDVASGNAPVH